MGSGLGELRRSVASADALAPVVSGWSVGMQIQHCCLAMIGVCRQILASQPPPPTSRFSPLTTLIFLSGRIPRGRGKSPEQAVPREDVSRDELMGMLDESERLLVSVRAGPAGAWYDHFKFGVMNRDLTLKFIRIHNRHHLRIISDILAAEGVEG